MNQRNLIPIPRQGVPSAAHVVLQRKCGCGQHTGSGGCEECRKKGSPETHGLVTEALRSSGHSLTADVSDLMGRRIGHDFSRVRVHTDELAARSAQSVNALAYTVGSDVVFGAGQYAPTTSAGRRLIAHELTHVAQQRGGAGEIRNPGAGEDNAELEADGVAHAIEGGLAVPRLSTVPGGLQRAPAPEGSPPRGFDSSLLRGGTLPYREATELLKCIQIMGEESKDYCREQVLGEKVTPAMPEAGEPPQATEGKPERKVVVQPPPRAVKPTDLKKAAGKEDAPESEPWKVTPKLGVEGGTSRQLRTGRRENAQSAVVGVEFDKEGAGSLGAELKGEHAKETVPGKEPESSFSLELAVDGKIPVGSWIFNPEKIKPWVFFKEIGLQGSLATKRSPGPDAETLRTLAGELTVDLIGLELRSKKLDLGLGLSTIMKMEGMKGADGPKWSYELGGKVGADAKVRPTGGTFFIFVEGSAKLTTTKEKGGSFQPGIFAFTLLGGVGWEFPISRKRASRR